MIKGVFEDSGDENLKKIESKIGVNWKIVSIIGVNWKNFPIFFTP